MPIGSVVKLSGATKDIMIIGNSLQDMESSVKYDYLGIPFPEGYIDNENMFLFNRDDIEDVKFLGYINAESQEFSARLAMKLDELDSEK